MERYLGFVLSDYAVIAYEIIGIIVAIIVGNILDKRIKKINASVKKKEFESLYSQLDSAIENRKRR